MTAKIEIKLRSFPAEYLTDTDLACLLPGSPHSRAAQIKRAVAKGYLIRICRNLYYLGDYLARYKPHPYEVAQHIYWPSYISLEAALAYHGLIPEAVYTVTSVTPLRAKAVKTPLGIFSYATLPKKDFFIGTERITEGPHVFLIASPWKAILDYVYCYKKDWRGLEPLTESLRIEFEDLPKPNLAELNDLKEFYQSKRIALYVKSLQKELF